MAFLDLADVRIRYELDGTAGGPVLVLSNSLGSNLSMWDGQVAAFAGHFRVLRYDQRGHGQSSIPAGPYEMAQFGSDFLGLLSGLEVESCYFCGLSMGGVLGQWLGVNAAHRVRKLVLSNTAAKIGTNESWDARMALVRTGGVAAAIPLVLERWLTPEFQARFPKAVGRVRAMLALTDADGYLASCAALRNVDYREVVAGIGLPTLVVAGSRDLVTSPSQARDLAEKIAGARYVELEAAHLSNVEAATAFNSAVLDFLLS